jgi:hypothetical protein
MNDLLIIRKQCEIHSNIPHETFESKIQKREVVLCRQLAMHFSKKLTKHSLSVIGAFMGGKDHCTVLYAYNHISDLLETDHQFAEEYKELENNIKSRIYSDCADQEITINFTLKDSQYQGTWYYTFNGKVYLSKTKENTVRCNSVREALTCFDNSEIESANIQITTPEPITEEV